MKDVFSYLFSSKHLVILDISWQQLSAGILQKNRLNFKTVGPNIICIRTFSM